MFIDFILIAKSQALDWY